MNPNWVVLVLFAVSIFMPILVSSGWTIRPSKQRISWLTGHQVPMLIFVSVNSSTPRLLPWASLSYRYRECLVFAYLALLSEQDRSNFKLVQNDRALKSFGPHWENVKEINQISPANKFEAGLRTWPQKFLHLQNTPSAFISGGQFSFDRAGSSSGQSTPMITL